MKKLKLISISMIMACIFIIASITSSASVQSAPEKSKSAVTVIGQDIQGLQVNLLTTVTTIADESSMVNFQSQTATNLTANEGMMVMLKTRDQIDKYKIHKSFSDKEVNFSWDNATTKKMAATKFDPGTSFTPTSTLSNTAIGLLTTGMKKAGSINALMNFAVYNAGSFNANYA